MHTQDTGSAAVDEYIGRFPVDTQAILNQLREAIRSAAPQAAEKISYQMPCFVLHGNLVWYAAYSRHIGFYPTPGGIEKFKDELAAYECSKGAVRFPLGQPIPLDLVRRMVAFRVQQNLEKAKRA